MPADELQRENVELRRRLAELMERARYNERVLARFQKVELRLIGIVSFKELIEAILEDYRDAFELDVVTLSLIDADYDLRRTLMDAEAAPEGFPGLIIFDRDVYLSALFGAGNQPVLGSFDPARQRVLFPAESPVPSSVAILPLTRWGQLVGSLNLGSLRPDRFAPGMATHFIEWLAAVASVCLENVANNERLKHIGLTDALTGVHNRRYFEQRLREEVDRALRKGSPLSCLLVDLDHFKSVNDRYGHLIGDAVLREVAEQIKDQLRLSDAMARYGGEEFAVLLVQTNVIAARAIAERIRERIAGQAFKLPDATQLDVTISVGIATLMEELRGADIDARARDLVGRADSALYTAKRSGRNRVATARGPTTRAAARSSSPPLPG
ncbi:MAG: sensor domain-containing diguanylate cyclase [Burkholderiales bacterium]|nr:sensor domain-containing diguanylate cyclase [Burkholderiales bacterium]